ncbi:MAG: PUR family DNA/RNA-binding protein [Flavobacteriales bacterium]|nr:PUR family DNA/RNA-binding protein [Flavobacteriales bacterium]MCB9447671.1 PUR family DNA/RNA-binding protein [Flavobacteriales bacterium]
MEDFEKDQKQNQEEIYSKVVRAGKRTYFFDVKSTRSNDYYLTITESKRRFSNDDNKFFYEKHKLFLYKEDFDKFKEGLAETILKIQALQEENPVQETHDREPSENGHRKEEHASSSVNAFSDVSFEDLGKEHEEEVAEETSRH